MKQEYFTTPDFTVQLAALYLNLISLHLAHLTKARASTYLTSTAREGNSHNMTLEQHTLNIGENHISGIA